MTLLGIPAQSQSSPKRQISMILVVKECFDWIQISISPKQWLRELFLLWCEAAVKAGCSQYSCAMNRNHVFQGGYYSPHALSRNMCHFMTERQDVGSLPKKLDAWHNRPWPLSVSGKLINIVFVNLPLLCTHKCRLVLFKSSWSTVKNKDWIFQGKALCIVGHQTRDQLCT